MTRKVNFRLPDELVEKADVAAEVSHKNRTEIIKDAPAVFGKSKTTRSDSGR